VCGANKQGTYRLILKEMNHNQDIGKQGEDIAVAFLIKNGFTILHRNWRFSHLEVDIFASKNGMLHIIEVKTRTTYKYGNPEEQITTKKFRLLQDAAVIYQELFPAFTKIQFDIVAININQNEEPTILFLEDFFI
jgi:putative endonuclease